MAATESTCYLCFSQDQSSNKRKRSLMDEEAFVLPWTSVRTFPRVTNRLSVVQRRDRPTVWRPKDRATGGKVRDVSATCDDAIAALSFLHHGESPFVVM